MWWFAYKASRRKSPQTTTETSKICRIWDDGYSRKHRAPQTRLGYFELAIYLRQTICFFQHSNNHHPKFWRWFAVVYGAGWFAVVCLLSTVFTINRPKFWCDLWWFAVICGRLTLWSFVVVCGGLSYSHTVMRMSVCHLRKRVSKSVWVYCSTSD